jgi:hypothetical protein
MDCTLTPHSMDDDKYRADLDLDHSSLSLFVDISRCPQQKYLPPPGIVYQHLSQSSFQFLSWTFISLFFPRSRYLFDSYAIRPSSNSWERFSVLCFDGDSFGAFFVWLLRLRRRRLYHCSLDILYITTTTHHPSSTPRHRRSFSVLPFGVETLECLLFCWVWSLNLWDF